MCILVKNIKNNGTLKPAMESLCNQAIRAVFGIKSMYKAKKKIISFWGHFFKK